MSDHQDGQQQCAECGGWTFDPAFHSERYQHRFTPRDTAPAS